MISLIFPVYNEEPNLSVLYDRITKVAGQIVEDAFEFIFVDDCSSDKTPHILKRLHEKDKRVKSIRFARNCGSHAAIVAGLNYCTGDAAIILAALIEGATLFGLVIMLLFKLLG